MHKYAWLAVALTSLGCGSKDDCQRAFDKLTPVMEKMAGQKLTDDEKAKELAECRAKGNQKDDPVMKCVLDAKDDDAVKACVTAGVEDYMAKSKQSMAKLQLNKLMKNAKIYFITNAEYPKGSAATLPAEPCCKAADHKCPVTAAWAKDPTWQALDFQIDEPSDYQFSYTSDGKTVTATAVGDPSCSGTPGTYTLKMTSDNGDPQSTLTEPGK